MQTVSRYAGDTFSSVQSASELGKWIAGKNPKWARKMPKNSHILLNFLFLYIFIKNGCVKTDIPSQFTVKSSFLTWKIFIFFPRWVDFTPSLLHSFTSCQTFRNTGAGGWGGEALNMKRHGMLVGKFEFNSYERLMWTLPELHYTPKRWHLKRNRFDY